MDTTRAHRGRISTTSSRSERNPLLLVVANAGHFMRLRVVANGRTFRYLKPLLDLTVTLRKQPHFDKSVEYLILPIAMLSTKRQMSQPVRVASRSSLSKNRRGRVRSTVFSLAVAPRSTGHSARTSLQSREIVRFRQICRSLASYPCHASGYRNTCI
jgi:hypothetical protein